MKKLAKKLLCLTAVLALTLSLFTGCKSKNEKTLFEYAGQEVTFQEAHVYARIMQYQAEAQYGAYFGDSMWSMQVGTDSKGKKITMQQSVKDSVINQLKQIKVLAAHADDYNVKLTKSEKKQIKESVTAFAKDSTGKKVMKKTEADKDMIQKLYEESTIASKVMQAIIKKANVTVTDDEAKTVKVYKLVFTTKTTDSKTGKEKDMTAAEKKDQLKKAKSALKMIKKGQSISSVAKKFSVNSDNEESYTKGKATLGTKFETAAAKLKKNQVSGVVELDDAYVIIKMLNPNDTTAAASNKSTLLQEKQQAAYEKVYKKWTKDADKKWDDKKSVDQDLWKEVKFKYKATTASTAATTTTSTSGKTVPCLQVVVERPNKKPLVATWGGISLVHKRKAVIEDIPYKVYGGRTELVKRLLAEKCELCGSTENIEVHHIRKLADLKKKGQAEVPKWVQIMSARKRKTLVVCRECHVAIHNGTINKPLS